MKICLHVAYSVRVQRICEIISTNSSKIAIHENLDPRKFSAKQYIVNSSSLGNIYGSTNARMFVIHL